MRRIAISLSLVLIVSSVAAQLVETIEVRVANVDVVVTDRAGKPVHGLTKDDFEILENGKPQPITNFYELREGAAEAATGGVTLPSATPPPADLQRRRVVIFIDQEGVAPNRRAMAFAALTKSLDRVLRQGDEAMVVTFSREKRVATNLTSDVEVVKRALADAATAANSTTTRTGGRERVIQNANEMIDFARENPKMMSMAQAYRQSYNAATAYADELYTMQRRLVGGLQQTIAAMAGLDGKKVLIFVGGDFQARPGVDVFDAVDNIFRPVGVSIVGSAQTGESAKRSLQADFEKLAREANMNGVTMYLIDAVASRGMSTRSAEEKASLEGNEGIDAFADIETLMSMNAIATQTGGRALVGSTNYELALDNVARDLGSYYSLGYKPTGDGERRIAVRMKKPGLVARSRRSFTLESADEQLSDRVAANAFHTLAGNEMPVTVQVGKAEPDGDVFRVPLTVKFPGDITAIPDGQGSLSAEFGIYVRTASVDGNISPVVKDVRNFKYPQAHAKAVQAQQVTYTMGLRVRAGEQIVSVAVVDKVSGRTGYGRMKFTAP